MLHNQCSVDLIPRLWSNPSVQSPQATITKPMTMAANNNNMKHADQEPIRRSTPSPSRAAARQQEEDDHSMSLVTALRTAHAQRHAQQATTAPTTTQHLFPLDVHTRFPLNAQHQQTQGQSDSEFLIQMLDMADLIVEQSSSSSSGNNPNEQEDDGHEDSTGFVPFPYGPANKRAQQ